MKFLMSLALLFTVHQFAFGQDGYIDVKKLPAPDCTGKQTMNTKFAKTSEANGVIVVVPDNPSEADKMEGMLQYYDQAGIKKESELTQEDYFKAIILLGVISDFKHWESFEIPINRMKDGFVFNNETYADKSDAIYYASENRCVYTGNSMTVIQALSGTMQYYDYMILRNGLLSEMFIHNEGPIDLDAIREANYDKQDLTYYNLFVDKKIKNLEISDSIIVDICQTMDLPLPTFKINAYCHHNPNATRLFSNFYPFAGCDVLADDMVFGTVQLEAIHVTGRNKGMISHETFHVLWEKLVSQDYGNQFFNEGIQTYYEFLKSPQKVSNAVKIQKKYPDYDILKMVTKGDSQSFWSGPGEGKNNMPISYDISGLVVKFMVENWGLDNFKRFFANPDKTEAIRTMCGVSPEQLVVNYKGWLQQFPDID